MSASAAEQGASNTSLYLGLGVGIGGLLLAAIVAIVVQIIRKTRQHSRSSLLENGQINVPISIRRSSDIRRTMSLGRNRSEQLGSNNAAWNPLASSETLDETSARKKLPYLHLAKRSKKHGIPLKGLKHLSAIVESPRSRATQSPMISEIASPEMAMGHESWPVVVPQPAPIPAGPWAIKRADIALSRHTDSELGNARLDTLLQDDRPKPPRSVSMGMLTSHEPLLAPSLSIHRLRTHGRSASLGAKPPDHLPPDPIPGLPIIAPHDTGRDQTGSRPRFSTSSISSEESASSSVLISSPSFRRYAAPNETPKPGMRPLAPNRSEAVIQQIMLKDVAQDDTKNGLGGSGDGKRELASMDSSSSFDHYPMSQKSTGASVNRAKRARISPAPSIRTKRESCRRPSQFSVSADGSPTERKRTGVLQDISGNASMTSRQSSMQHSPTSSEGNPFQWDPVTLQKPSALKGSPNARKGHRRNNCVRISTLTPQVLGPPPSRPGSPSITHRIDEEGADENGRARNGDLPFVTNRRPSRPASTLGVGQSLRVQTLRASLTPGSPTASLWTAFHDNELASQPSDSQLSTSSGGFIARPLSAVSSNLSIPSFPSPSRVTLAEVQRDQPVPEFSVSRQSLESDTPPSPLDPSAAGEKHLSSSPPSPINSTLYDPAWIPYNPQAPSRLGASLRETSRPVPFVHERLTSGNASSIMARLPSDTFINAPVLRPTPGSAADDYSYRNFRFPAKDEQCESPIGQQDIDRERARSPKTSLPGGPREEPCRSVLKNAMALRRMNSDVDTSACREIRRYVQLGREASPPMPYFLSPNPSESCASFDFGFEKPLQAQDSVSDLALPTVPGLSIKRGNSKTYPKSILKPRLDRVDSPGISPLTDKVSYNAMETKDKPGMGTPNSLYDETGFLR